MFARVGFWHHLELQESLAHADSAVQPLAGPCPTCTCTCTCTSWLVQFDDAAVKVSQSHVHHCRVEKGHRTSSVPYSHLPNGETEALRGKEAHLDHRALAPHRDVWLSQWAEVLQLSLQLGADPPLPTRGSSSGSSNPLSQIRAFSGVGRAQPEALLLLSQPSALE